MKKPEVGCYERFAEDFTDASAEAGKKQFIVPYFIVGHPGSTLKDTVELARWVKRQGLRPRQIQEFIPTPMSVATCMYFTGINPLTSEPVAVVRDLREKRMMKALLMYWDEAQQDLAREALSRLGRRDLVGYHGSALVPPGPKRPRPGSAPATPNGPGAAAPPKRTRASGARGRPDALRSARAAVIGKR
jgi:hypothetical protein